MRQMRARFLLIMPISMCLFAGNDGADAQEAPGVQALPPVVVTGTKPGAKRGRDRNATRAVRTQQTIEVVGVSPVPGGEIDRQKVPSNVQTIDASDLDHAKTPSLLDGMVQSLPGVSLSDHSGNAFQRNLDYRGFTASPVPGTVQGLAVYQNGTRINEAFGDVVNWDLIPEMAIARMTLMPNNPLFGLNAIGGAINVQMKNGFNYHSAEIDTMGGAFGRIQSSAQWGKQYDHFA